MGRPVTKKCKGNATDTFSPVLLVSELFGICTLRANTAERKLNVSVPAVLYTTVSLLLCTLHMVLIPYFVNYLEKVHQGSRNITLEDFNFNTLTQHYIAKLIDPMIIAISATYFRIYALLRMPKRLPLLFNCTSKVDDQLHLSLRHHRHDSLRIALYVLYIFAASPLHVYSLTLAATDCPVAFSLYAMSTYNNFGMVCIEFQFISLCYMLESRFKSINEKLKIFGSHAREKFALPKNTLSTICIQIDTIPLKNKKMLSQDLKMADEIQTLREAHAELSKLAVKMNNHFGFRIFISLICCTTNVLINAYFAIFGGYGKLSGEKRMVEVISGILWTIFYFQRFVCLCTAAERMRKQANSTKWYVYNVLNRNVEPNTKEELWIFLSRLSDAKLKLSVCGFFKLDYTLITTAVATGATYLIVLAQFRTI